MNELTTQPNPFAVTNLNEAMALAEQIASSGCFGITKPAQAITLMMMAREEGKTLAQLLKEVHVFDTGKLSQRADYTQAVFQQNGTILWHLRTNTVVAGSFFTTKPIDDAARARACERFELQYELDIMQMQDEWDRKRESELMLALSKLAREGECTVIRTLADAEAKGITMGKNGTKNNWAAGAISMLQWRCVTDAVKLIDPSVMSGLSSDVDLQDARVVEQQLIEQQPRQTRAEKEVELNRLLDQQGATDDEQERLALHKRAMALDKEIQQMPREKEPAKIVDATDATVHPPEKDGDQIPGIDPPREVAAPRETLNVWQEYKIQTVTAKKGVALMELSAPEIKTLHAAFMKKDLPRAAKAVQKDATMIAMAYEAIGGGK